MNRLEFNLKTNIIMKKSILKLKGAEVLSFNQQKEIKGGVAEGWGICCLKSDSPPLPPIGCFSWVICDSDLDL